jgi:hypothetical protein
MRHAVAATLLAGGLALAPPAAAGADTFEVTQSGPRAYRARGSFVVPTTSAAAWAAIADYEGIPRVAPSVKSSRVVRRDRDTVIVEQEGVASVLFFSKRIRLLLEIVENPPREISFRDTDGRDFDSYEGFWTIEETPGGLRVSYGLDVERGFAAPDFLARPFFRKQAESLMGAMREEILRRSASATPPPEVPRP